MSKPTLDRAAIAEARARCDKAMRGPWRWVVNLTSRSVHLEAAVSGLEIVMDFARWGMNGARPRFQAAGLMVDAEQCAVVVPERKHHASWHQTLAHPDADFIAHARTDLPAALDAAEAYLDLVERIEREATDCEAAARLAGGSMTVSGRHLFQRAEGLRALLAPAPRRLTPEPSR